MKIREIIQQEIDANPKPTWCYISGPYTHGDCVANTTLMCLEWKRLQHKYPGMVFINPLLSMFQHAISPEEYEFWIDYDLNLIKVLAMSGPGVVYRFRPDVPSSGADEEMTLADKLGIPVVLGNRLDIYLDERLDKRARVQHVEGEIEEGTETYTNAKLEAILNQVEADRSQRGPDLVAGQMMPGAREFTHPMQSVYIDKDDRVRFVENKIVRHLLDFASSRGGGLNYLAHQSDSLGFTRNDWRQFAQLIGYSLSGFEELSYVGVCYEEAVGDGYDAWVEQVLDAAVDKVRVLATADPDPTSIIKITDGNGDPLPKGTEVTVEHSVCDHEWVGFYRSPRGCVVYQVP